ncbi:MAG: DUF393 domain-containing protein [Ahrensia sp.]|nr:DUF393 domain-containing protein [Ahrensia sp.]
MKNIEVFYDGDCPICKIEVDLYRKFGDQSSMRWIDITDLSDLDLPVGKTRETLLNRFHVREAGSEQWFIGVDAFARIWRQLPWLKHFAFIFSLPLLRQVAEVGYRAFLKWQNWHRKNRRKSVA